VIWNRKRLLATLLNPSSTPGILEKRDREFNCPGFLAKLIFPRNGVRCQFADSKKNGAPF